MPLPQPETPQPRHPLLPQVAKVRAEVFRANVARDRASGGLRFRDVQVFRALPLPTKGGFRVEEVQECAISELLESFRALES